MPTVRALVDSLGVQQDRRQLVADTLQELGYLLDEQAGEALGALTEAQLQNVRVKGAGLNVREINALLVRFKPQGKHVRDDDGVAVPPLKKSRTDAAAHRERLATLGKAKLPMPSSYGKPLGDNSWSAPRMQSLQEAMCHHRPARSSNQQPTPIVLFDPILAQLAQDCESATPSKADCKFAAKVSHAMSETFANETIGMKAFWALLQKEFGIPLHQAARCFTALRAALLSLRTFYDFLDAETKAKRPLQRQLLYPYPAVFTNLHDAGLHHTQVQLTYTNKLGRLCFKGVVNQMGREMPVFVKFCRSYHKESHDLLASKGFAPTVLGLTALPGGWFMVIMEFADGCPWDESGCSTGKKGVVYDFFFQYGPSVQVTNSDYWVNFDSGFDSSITDPAIIAKHQPIVWGTDRIDSSYSNINALATKPQYLLTFNEPNYAFGGGSPTNIVDPVTAAGLWPQLLNYFDPLGIQLIAPSAIDCSGDPNCHNVGTAAGWLSAFQSALNSNSAAAGAWDAIHALSYHTYATDLGSIISETTSLYQQFGKPIWITEIASGGGLSMEANVALMEAFVPWANSQPWIERYFWNQATPAEGTDANIQNSYLVNKSADGSGDGSLSVLGQVYANFPC